MQFTQEVRLASAANAPVRLSDGAALRWQSGVFFFTQNYDQEAVNNFSPFVLSPFVPFPVAQTSPAGGARRHRHRRLRPGHADVRGEPRPHARRARRSRAEGRPAGHVLLAGDRAAVQRDRRTELLERVTAAGRGVSRPVEPDALRDGRSRVQGRRLQSGVAARQRVLRRGAHLERRGRRQDGVGRRPRHHQRVRVPDRLGRPAAEPAEPVGARTVLHRQRRRRQQRRRRARGERPAHAARGRVRDAGLHARAFR